MAVKRGQTVSPSPRFFLVALGLLLTALLVLVLGLAARADGFIYWTKTEVSPKGEYTGAIARANLDGTGVNQDFITFELADRFSMVGDVAPGANRLYWTESELIRDESFGHSVSSIGRAKIAGTGVKRRLIRGLPVSVESLAFSAEHVYWTWNVWDAGTGLAQSPGIGRANLDGSGVDQHFIDLKATGLGIGDIVTGSDYLYWATDVGIGRANLDGTEVDPGFVAAGNRANGLAVDTQHLYWTTPYSDPHGLGNAIGRANLDGSAVDQRYITSGVGLKPPFWGDLEIYGSQLFWTISEPNLGAAEILRANLDGTDLEAVIPDSEQPGDGLAVDGRTDRVLAGKASAARTQRQDGKGIVVRVKVKAKETLTAKAAGKIRVDPTYKLRPRKVELDPRQSKTLRLRPKQGKAKKIVAALKRGKAAKARLTVKLTDLVGNTKTEKLGVRLVR